jgi:hypothetical protein
MSLHQESANEETVEILQGQRPRSEFTGSEDPLDPGTDTGEPIAIDTFTGRRVKAGR